jgi:hypothetical protein
MAASSWFKTRRVAALLTMREIAALPQVDEPFH